MEKETLEEAMNQNGYHESDYDKIWREGVEFGTKWQAEQLFKDDAIKTLETCMAFLLKKIERMYSEEEVFRLTLDALDLGMRIRQDQLRGHSEKSGKELHEEWFDQSKK